MTTALATISRASKMLATCTDLTEIKDLRDKAEAVRQYAKAAGAGLAAQNSAAHIKSLAEHRAGVLLAGMDRRHGARDGKTGLRDDTPLLSDLGVTKTQSHRWQTIAQLEDTELTTLRDDMTKQGKELTSKYLFALGKQRKASAVEDEPPTDTEGVVTELNELDGMTFGTIYADPPWKYGNQSTRAATDNHYPTMTVDELCAMPIAGLAADKSHLHLWTTNAFLFDAKRVVEAWGFEYKSCFIWVKPQMGIGNYWRVSHEFMLLGVRGGHTFDDHGQMSWLMADRGRHSVKPHAVRAIIEKVSPGPRLELFGREETPRWTVFGNQFSERPLL